MDAGGDDTERVVPDYSKWLEESVKVRVIDVPLKGEPVPESPEEQARRVAEMHAAFLADLRVGSAADGLTLDELKLRVLEFIENEYSARGRGVTLKELNRRFGVVASRLGSTVRAVVDEFAKAQRLTGVKYGTRQVVLPYGFALALPELQTVILLRTE